MRRTLSVLFWILLGAVSASASLGYFLFEANQDRATLSQQAAEAQNLLEQTKTANTTLAEEANKKVAAASAEVARTQQALQRTLAENQMIAKAIPLVKPDAKTLKGWGEAVSITMGLSMKIPKDAQSQQTDRAFVVQTSPKIASTPVEQWLTVSPYQQTLESELAGSIKNAQTVVYKVADHVVIGVKGTWADLPGTAYLLRVQAVGSTSTHLIWAKTLPTVTEEKILQTLATLSFKS